MHHYNKISQASMRFSSLAHFLRTRKSQQTSILFHEIHPSMSICIVTSVSKSHSTKHGHISLCMNKQRVHIHPPVPT